MSEKNRIKKQGFNFRLLKEEEEILKQKALDAGMTKTEFLRSIILFGNVQTNRRMGKEELKQFLYELNRIGNNINQIAYNSNLKKSTDQIEVIRLTEEFKNLLGLFEQFAFDGEGKEKWQ